MKKLTVGIFSAREDAEKAINRVHNELHVPTEDISYVYRNREGAVQEVNADDIATSTTSEGTRHGALVGGSLGALAGIATVMGIIPVIGPLFVAGPLIAALGLGGAVATTAAGAVAGAAAGGVVGALSHLGVGQEHAQRYADLVSAGDILVSVYAPEDTDVRALFHDAGALETEAYGLTV